MIEPFQLENRATNVPVEIRHAGGTEKRTVNMRLAPPLESGFFSLGQFEFSAKKPGAVVISCPLVNRYRRWFGECSTKV